MPSPYRFLAAVAVLAASLGAALPSAAQHTARPVPGMQELAPRNLIVVGDTLYFVVCEVVCDAAGDAEGRRGLWSYDAATGRAEPRVEFDVQLRDAPFPLYTALIAYDGALFFNADDSVHGNELWRYDPATGQAALVADLRVGSEDSDPINFTIYDGALYFRAIDETYGSKLHRYRTGEGIHTLDHSPGPFLGRMAALGDQLYLVDGNSLISYDSTTDQFTTLTHPFDANRAAVIGGPTAYDGRIYVKDHTLTHTHGTELWAYDPATGDFSLVADINPGSDSSSPSNLATFDGALYFLAFDKEHGAEFWRYDGSAPPALVADINPGPDHSVPSTFTSFEGRLYFHANDGTSGAELWVFDPATEEVALAADLAPGDDGSSPRWMVPYDSALYVATRNAGAGGTSGVAVTSTLWRVERTPPTSDERAATVKRGVLHPVFPSPFADAATIRFELPLSKRVRIEVFDLLGRRVALLADENYAAGEHTLRWDGRGCADGLYFVRLQAGETVQTRRAILAR